MSPHRIDPNVDYQRLKQLSVEFTDIWKRMQSLYLDSAAGFALVRSSIEEEQSQIHSLMQESGSDIDDYQALRLFTYDHIFSNDFCTSGIHKATQGEVKARNGPDGANLIAIGQLCLVSFFDYWNEYLRREYVIAIGKLDPNETVQEVINQACRVYASNDLWGDIRRLRQSIVHNRGIATADVSRCLLIKWFQPGEQIAISSTQMRALFLALLRYRNELFNEQFPEFYIQVP